MIKKLFIQVFVLLLLILNFSCIQNKIPNILINKEADSFARNYLELLKNKNFDLLREHSTEQFNKPDENKILNKIADLLKDANLDSLEIVFTWNSTQILPQKIESFLLRYQLKLSELWGIISFEIINVDNKLKTKVLNLNINTISLQEYHKFTLKNKSFWHYFVLFLSFTFILITIYFIIDCIRQKDIKIFKKILWILAMGIGVITISFNWTNGSFDFRIISFLYPFVSIGKMVFGPYIFGLSFPIGLLGYLDKRFNILKNLETQNKESGSQFEESKTEDEENISDIDQSEESKMEGKTVEDYEKLYKKKYLNEPDDNKEDD